MYKYLKNGGKKMQEQEHQDQTANEDPHCCTAEHMKQKTVEMQEKATESLNKAMSATAESLDKTANKLHDVSKFFRDKDADGLKEDFSNLVKKYPGKTLAGIAFVGFLIGRIISKQFYNVINVNLSKQGG